MKRTIFAGALALAASAPAAAVTIDFSDRPTGVNPSPLVYPEATFSTTTGQFFVGAAGVDDEICPLTAGFNCEAELSVTFNGAVNNLRFQSNGEQSAAAQLFLTITTLTGVNSLTLSPFDGNFTSLDNVDLSAYLDVTGLLITTDDGAGVAYDNFSFDLAGAVPEPSTWAMLIAGFGLVGVSARRRNRSRVTYA